MKINRNIILTFCFIFGVLAEVRYFHQENKQVKKLRGIKSLLQFVKAPLVRQVKQVNQINIEIFNLIYEF